MLLSCGVPHQQPFCQVSLHSTHRCVLAFGTFTPPCQVASGYPWQAASWSPPPCCVSSSVCCTLPLLREGLRCESPRCRLHSPFLQFGVTLPCFFGRKIPRTGDQATGSRKGPTQPMRSIILASCRSVSRGRASRWSHVCGCRVARSSPSLVFAMVFG